MKLVGVFLSPFVRRVAATLNLLEIPFEHVNVSVVDSRDVIGSYNKLVKIPSLELDDGTVLIDSHEIVTELDRIVGSDRSLVPQEESSLRAYGQMIAYLTGACEKTVASLYEVFRRPAEKVWSEWAEQCQEQAIGGLEAAETNASNSLLDDGYLFEDKLTHADVLAVIAYETLSGMFSEQVNTEAFPKLSSLAGRLGETEPFVATRM